MDVYTMLTITLSVLISMIDFLVFVVYEKLNKIEKNQSNTDVKIAEVLKDVQLLNKYIDEFKENHKDMEIRVKDIESRITKLEQKWVSKT